MSIIGLIPAIALENLPLTFIPAAMLPYDYLVMEDKRVLKPVAQVALEGMVAAGVDQVIFIVNDAHMPMVSQYFRDGYKFGIPISYVTARGPGLALAISSCYGQLKGHTVVMALPGIVTIASVRKVLEIHKSGSNALTMSVSQNASLKGSRVRAPGTQKTGVFAWSEEFTDYVRQRSASRPEMSFAQLVDRISDARLSARGVKIDPMPILNTTLAITGALKMHGPMPDYVVDED